MSRFVVRGNLLALNHLSPGMALIDGSKIVGISTHDAIPSHWNDAPIYEAAAWRVLHEAGVQATAVNVTPGGCCHWHIVVAIKKQPGDGKNAMMALLSIAIQARGF